MSKFKVGDIVRCVLSGREDLTYGRIYEIIAVCNGWYRVVADQEQVDGYREHAFELVEHNPAIKLEDEELDSFTPKRLLGVETNYGYITTVLSLNFGFTPSLYVYTTESLSKENLMNVHNLKYYVSDESDETVSYDEYVEKFYER